MKSELSQHQIEAYREDGFIIIEDFLSKEELEEWRIALDEAVRRRGNSPLPRMDEQHGEDQPLPGDGTSYYENVFIQRLNLWMDNPRMKHLILDERIGKMACELEGIDAIRVWHDQTLIKNPWGNPTSWHIDNPFWSFYSEHSISIWIALDDATVENGCLWFLPGTHKKKSFENVAIGPNIADLFKLHPEWGKMTAVPAPMKAGSASFHNGLTAHGAGANMTPGFRRAMTCAFMPDGSVFNGQQNVLPKRLFKNLQIGDLLNDDAQNPIVYSRSRVKANV